MTTHYPIVLEHEPNGSVSAFVVGVPGVFAAADTERAATAAIRKALSAHQAIDLFADLLHAEARRIRLATTEVNISRRVNVPDEGVDASVTKAPATESGLIRAGLTVFQLKTGAFEPWQPAEVRRELIGKAKPSKAALGQRLAEVLDAGGRYVLVCTGQDLTDPQRAQGIGNLQEILTACGYKQPNVDVLSQGQLIGSLANFPSIALNLNGHAAAHFQGFASWAENDQMRTEYRGGAAQFKAISSVREGLEPAEAATHIRVRGEPGVGKTRMVLEAVGTEQLAPLVLYCDSPHVVKDHGVLNEILKQDNPFEVVLIVDECDADAAVYLWDRLKHKGPRIRLVSIFNEFDTLDVPYVDAPPLEKAEIVKILEDYIPATESADRWAELCEGSARMAHVIGGNLRRYPDDLLTEPGTVRVWDRYVMGNDDPKSQSVQQRYRVLRYLALFKRFGYRDPHIDEAKYLSERIRTGDPSITWDRFQEIVEELKRRRILQGETTLYITPRPLHIKLWADWWDIHGNGFQLPAFLDGLPSTLIEWFYEMFRYGHQSQAATRIVQWLLGPEGPFHDGEFLDTEDGSHFFLALTDASPESALACLKATVGTWSPEKLLDFKTGRRNVIWALERIAVWRALFPDASRVLLALAAAENESWANNATGLFAALFSPASAPVAPTEAPPNERFPILKEALLSASKQRRLIAIQACDTALETQMFSRAVGAEHQGLRRSPTLWTPATWGELFDAYRKVWRLLEESLDHLEGDEKAAAIDVILRNARGLYGLENLGEMVIETVSRLEASPDLKRTQIIKLVEEVLHYDGKELTPERRAPWEHLRDSLVGNDFASRMQRYVGMDLIEDYFDENEERVDKAHTHIQELAREAFDNTELLWPELDWLMGDDAKNAYRFGFQLGSFDAELGLLQRLVDEQRKRPNLMLLAGYLRALQSRDHEAWEGQLDAFAADATLQRSVPELTWRGELTDRGAHRVLTLAARGVIEPAAFGMFAFGGVIRKLSPAVFNEWIEFLLRINSHISANVALDLYHFYYAWQDPPATLPEELTFRVLTAAPLFRAAESKRGATSNDHDWTKIAQVFNEHYPERLVDLAAFMLQHAGEDNTIIARYRSPTSEILDTALRSNAAAVWDYIATYLGPPIDSRAFDIKQWLRAGALTFVPKNLILNWIDADVEKRAWYIASFVPPHFPGVAGSVTPRELLIRYGDREDVRRNLLANFSTEMWRGPESAHFQKKLDWLKELKGDETEPNVLRWFEEFIYRTQKSIERARAEEEREF